MRFHILGTIEAWECDSPIELRGSMIRTFLASLLLARGRVVSDARLMRVLWDENLPSTTRAQIHTYASRLRGLLGDKVKIERQPPGYRLELTPHDWERVDLVEFENLAAQGSVALSSGKYATASKVLRSALTLWNGPALGGVTDYLLTMEQPRLEEARLTVVENCIEAELAIGEHRSLITELTKLVAAEPMRERPRMQLMIALHRSGRTADALRVYQDFRAELADGLGLDPSTEIQELHQSILTSVPPQPAVAQEARHAVAVANTTLPPEPSDFIGRDREVKQVCAVLTGASDHDTRSTICAISGIGGVGKTALVLRVARLLRETFPDRQLLLDLGGGSPEPPSGAALLDVLLARLGIPLGELPESFADRVDLYRRTLTGTRTLLVLDDAHDERQVRPLLPAAPGCGVVITSRSPLAALEGAVRVPLDLFTPEESVRLLTQIAGAERIEGERPAAMRIADLCDHLPLAIRVCGARLIQHRHWPLDKLADRIAEPRRVLGELRAGDLDVGERLMPSFLALSLDQRNALRQLARLGPDSFAASTAAELLGLAAETANDLLDELVSAQLLTAEPPAGDRYRLPRLVLALALGQRLLFKAS